MILQLGMVKFVTSPIQGIGLSEVRIVRICRKELLLLNLLSVVKDGSRCWIVDNLSAHFLPRLLSPVA